MNKYSMNDATAIIKALETFPPNWTLTPVHNKAPKIKNWQHGIDRKTIIKELETGRANGIGLITGELSGCLMAIDCDGSTAHKLAEDLGGLPHTVSFTSSKDGRAQYLYLVPPEYQEILKGFTRKVLETGTKGEQLEIRYNASQSVLPPSQHPETDSYKWINSIENTPIAELPIWVIEQILDEKPKQPKLDFTQSQNFDPIPLIKCLSREHREWVANGINHGGRNDAGAELARDLIGTESQLQYLGIPYNDSARGLFDDYCDRCNPPINNRERETIWRSAQKDNPTPCLDDDKLENCYKGWQRKQRQLLTNNSKTNYQTSGNTALKPETQSNVVPFQRQQTQFNIEDIEEEFSKIAEQNLPKSKQQLKLNELARKCNYSPKEIAESYKNYLAEIEQKDSQDDVEIELKQLLKNRNQSLNLAEYLPGNLAKIGEFASRLCLRPELGLTAFLTTCSSLLKVGSKIHLLGYSNFKQPMGIYAAIVAQPSQQKSPLINEIILEPLIQLAEIEQQRFESEMRNYQIEYQLWEQDKTASDEPEKPTMRHHYITGSSQAGVRNLLDKQSQKGWGLLQISDELSGAYKNSGKSYNIGLIENELSYYDGQGTIEVLKDGLVTNSKYCLFSKIGGIQPGVIRDFLNGTDNNGFWSRWTFINQPVSPFIIPDNPPPSLSIIPMLTDFYNKLSQLPQLQLRLDPKAEKYFIGIQNICEQRRVVASSEALASLWGKMRGKIGRLAAILHVVEQVSQFGTVQNSEVSLSTLKKAVALAKFYFNESQSLYTSCSDGKLAPQLESILNIASARGTIAARDVQNFDRSLFGKKSGISADDIRSMFIQLSEMGHGQLEGSGSRLKFSNCSNCSKTVEDFTTAETTTTQGLQPTVVTVVEKNKNFQDDPINQLDEITHLDDVVEKPVEPENFTTVTTVPQNIDTVDDVAVVNSSTVPTTVTTVPLDYGERPSEPLPDDYSPTLAELTSAEPLPPLTNLAVLIDFDSLKEGETIFHANGTPHILRGQGWGYWLTADGLRIDKDNIGNFHRE